MFMLTLIVFFVLGFVLTGVYLESKKKGKKIKELQATEIELQKKLADLKRSGSRAYDEWDHTHRRLIGEKAEFKHAFEVTKKKLDEVSKAAERYQIELTTLKAKSDAETNKAQADAYRAQFYPEYERMITEQQALIIPLATIRKTMPELFEAVRAHDSQTQIIGKLLAELVQYAQGTGALPVPVPRPVPQQHDVWGSPVHSPDDPLRESRDYPHEDPIQMRFEDVL